ncbi:MAG: hypothetical protein Q4Q17_02630 [Tissierellia bacterium]|nr:hypothetical protein [Tissierellia bacterium]
MKKQHWMIGIVITLVLGLFFYIFLQKRKDAPLPVIRETLCPSFDASDTTQLVHHADTYFIGKILEEKETVQYEDGPYTVYEVEVIETFKGKAKKGSSLLVEVFGGVSADGKNIILNGEGNLPEKNKFYVFALERRELGSLVATYPESIEELPITDERELTTELLDKYKKHVQIQKPMVMDLDIIAENALDQIIRETERRFGSIYTFDKYSYGYDLKKIDGVDYLLMEVSTDMTLMQPVEESPYVQGMRNELERVMSQEKKEELSKEVDAYVEEMSPYYMQPNRMTFPYAVKVPTSSKKKLDIYSWNEDSDQPIGMPIADLPSAPGYGEAYVDGRNAIYRKTEEQRQDTREFKALLLGIEGKDLHLQEIVFLRWGLDADGEEIAKRDLRKEHFPSYVYSEYPTDNIHVVKVTEKTKYRFYDMNLQFTQGSPDRRYVTHSFDEFQSFMKDRLEETMEPTSKPRTPIFHIILNREGTEVLFIDEEFVN